MSTDGEYYMSQISLRPYQEKLISDIRKSIENGHKRILVQAHVGAGKCLGKGTGVLMADGNIKPVEDIKVGDKLASPTGGYRTVLSLATGYEELYKVIPVKGDSYVVNKSHILSLKTTPNLSRATLYDGTIIDSRIDDIINVRADVYYNSTPYAKHQLKGWRSGVDSFYGDEKKLNIPPYVLGLWLGDGTKKLAAISKPECNALNDWFQWAESLGLSVRRSVSPKSPCPTWYITNGKKGLRNDALMLFRSYGLTKDKHIPHEYKTASKECRLQLIAGLLDTDGYMANNGFDFISKDQQLSVDLAFLCRSVGLACYIKKCTKAIASTGFKGTYWRCSISGDCSIIPCRDKKAGVRRQKKRVNITGIKLEPIGIGQYFGFEIDGDRLFMLGDFTVTHNTIIAAEISRLAKAKLRRSLFIAPRRQLVYQAADKFSKLGLSVGIIMAGEVGFNQPLVQVGSIDTLTARINRGVMDHPDAALVMADEAHAVYSASRLKFLNNYPLVLGITATPALANGKGMGGFYTDIVEGPTMSYMVENGFLVPMRYFAGDAPDVAKVKLDADGDFQEKALAEASDKPELIGSIYRNYKRLAGDRTTLIFSVNRKHGIHIYNEFKRNGEKVEYIDANTPTEEREAMAQRVESGETKVIVNISVLAFGTDWPRISCVIIARVTRNISSWIQMVGRGSRLHPTKSDCLVIYHGHNFDELGPIDAPIEWSLDDKSTIRERRQKAQKERKEPKDITCKACGHIFQSRRSCPKCQHEMIPKGEAIPYHEADLVEVKKVSNADKEDWYQQMLGWCRRHGKKDGLAYYAYKDKFGIGPAWKKVAKEPGQEVVNYFKHRAIKRSFAA